MRLLQSVVRKKVVDQAGAAQAGDLPIVADLLNSDEFQIAISKLATQLGRDATSVRVEAVGYLREMAATHNPLVVGAWRRFSAWLVRGYDIVTKDADLAELRRLDRNHTLIFLISHRSYLDEFALPPRLVAGGISPCFGMAGANLDFFPLGTLARRNGVVHVRRASADTPVYRMTLRAMVGRMVTSGNNLVWSIEGSKQPEDVKWLAEYARRLEARLGRIYLDFGTPIPVYERLTALRAEGLDDRQVVERVALDICHRINRTTPVTATAAVCVAMLGEDRALTLDEVCATVAPLAHYLTARGWSVAGDENLTDPATVARTLKSLDDSGVLSCYADGPETVWGIGDEQHLVAAVYRNSAVHVLLVRAIAEVALQQLVQTPGGTTRTAWEAALALRELLKFDFFFAGRDEFADELWNEVALLTGARQEPATDVDPDKAAQLLAISPLLVAHLVLRPFIDAYRVVAEELINLDPQRAVDDTQFFDRCLRLAKQWSLQHRIASKESVSLEMFTTALKMARHRGLVDPDATADIGEKRRALVQQLDELQTSIETLAAYARKRDFSSDAFSTARKEW